MIDIPDTILPQDENGNVICPKCKNVVSSCSCPSYDPNKPKDVAVKIRLDQKGRKGKTVMVIEGFPKNEEFIKKITKKLKARCGSGGTYLLLDDSGNIEIQGQNIFMIESILASEGIKVYK